MVGAGDRGERDAVLGGEAGEHVEGEGDCRVGEAVAGIDTRYRAI